MRGDYTIQIYFGGKKNYRLEEELTGIIVQISSQGTKASQSKSLVHD